MEFNRCQANPRKAQKSHLHPTEAERYRKKLLAKAEIIVASANKIWGTYSETLNVLE
jgi:DNA polymerase theta